MDKKIIYIDMDDTICHFKSHYHKMLEINPHIQYPQSQAGFFTSLAPIDGAINGINELRKLHDVYILTRPSVYNPLCYTEKRLWVEEYFGLEFCHNLILCPHKGLMKGDFLIDDFPWPEFEGIQLQYGGDVFPTWTHVLNYFNAFT